MEPRGENFFKELIKFSLIAFLIVVPVRFFIFQPFIVSGASMEPTFQTNQYLIVDQLTYRIESPKRGDIVIFKFPEDTSKFFIKRVIGLPGETVEMRGTNVTIRNNEHPEGFVLDEPYISEMNERADYFTIGLKNDEYFVMGDNRAASSDSRVWGALPERYLIGRAFLRLLPAGKIGIFPGSTTAY